jgi:hypothetical protein
MIVLLNMALVLLAAALAAALLMPKSYAFLQSSSTFVTSSRQVVVRDSFASSSTRICNVPPKPILDEDSVAALKDAADREAPPQSFFQLQKNSVRAVQSALRDGHKLLEIEFPPLPANVLEMDDVSAYDIAEANTKLAVDFAKGFLAELPTSRLPPDVIDNFQITILFPDEAEETIAVKGALGGLRKPAPGIQTGSLRRSEEGDTRVFKVSTVVCIPSARSESPCLLYWSTSSFFIEPNIISCFFVLFCSAGTNIFISPRRWIRWSCKTLSRHQNVHYTSCISTGTAGH